MPDIPTIIEGLGVRQRAVVLALSGNEWRKAPCRQTAKRMFWGVGAGHLHYLIEHRHCPEDDREWGLTALGARVRAALEAGEGR